MFRILIPDTTDAAVATVEVMGHRSDFASLGGYAPKPVSIIAWGLAGTAHEINVQIPIVEGADPTNDDHWEDLVLGTDDVVLDAGNNMLTFGSPLLLRVSKPDTSDDEVGVGVFE